MNVRIKNYDGAAECEEVDMLWQDLDLGALVDAVSTLERVAAVRARRLRGDALISDAESDLEDFDVNAFIGLKAE